MYYNGKNGRHLRVYIADALYPSPRIKDIDTTKGWVRLFVSDPSRPAKVLADVKLQKYITVKVHTDFYVEDKRTSALIHCIEWFGSPGKRRCRDLLNLKKK